MPYNFLLLPVLFSYIILRYSSFFKYNTQRRSKEVLIFETFIFSAPIIVLAAFGNYFFRNEFNYEYKILANFFFEIYSPEFRFFYSVIFSGFIIISFLLFSELIFLLFFKFINKDGNNFLKNAIEKYGDELDNFLLNASEKGKMFQITLKNNKVYVGYLDELPIPSKSVFIEITPIKSGHRNKDNHQIKYDNSYVDVFQDLNKKILDIYQKDDITIDDEKNILELVNIVKSIKIGFRKEDVVIFSSYDPFVKEYFDNVKQET